MSSTSFPITSLLIVGTATALMSAAGPALSPENFEPSESICSARYDIAMQDDGTGLIELETPGFAFRLVPLSKGTSIRPTEAVFVLQRQNLNGPILQAELHRIYASCDHCGELAIKANGQAQLACPTCECGYRVERIEQSR